MHIEIKLTKFNYFTRFLITINFAQSNNVYLVNTWLETDFSQRINKCFQIQ